MLGMWLIRVLAGCGLAVSGFLLWESLGGGAALPGCGPGSGCDTVLGSGWSVWFGLPVSAVSAVLFVVILGASRHAWGVGRREQWAGRLVLVWGCVAASLGGLWFIGLQAWVVEAWCRWCLAVDVVAFLLGPIALWQVWRGGAGAWPTMGQTGFAVVAAVAGLLVLGGGQWWSVSRGPAQLADAVGIVSDEAGERGRELYLMGGRVRMTVDPLPRLGRLDAPVAVVYLYDYTCQHCRRLHAFWEAARERYGESLVVVMLPVPLDASCHPGVERTAGVHAGACELAELALGVWRADAGSFEAYDAWLVEAVEGGVDVAGARARAAELVGRGALEAAMGSGWPDEQLRRNTGLHEVAGGGLIPQYVVGQRWYQGRPGTAEELFEQLERETELGR